MRLLLVIVLVTGSSVTQADVSVGDSGAPQCGDRRWRALQRNFGVECAHGNLDAQRRRGCRLIRRALATCSEDLTQEVYGDTPGNYRISLRDPRDGSYAWFVDTEREKLTSYKYEFDDCTGP